MLDLKPFRVKADIMWASLSEPNSLSGKYQVDLCNLSDEATEKLKEMGVNVKHADEKGNYVVAKSKDYPIKTEMEDGSPVNVKVANGSKGTATIKPYEYQFRGKAGVSVGINKLVLSHLIEYTGTPEEEALEEAL